MLAVGVPQKPGMRWSVPDAALHCVKLTGASAVIGQLLPRSAALRIARSLALGAQRRARHQLEPARRDLVAALLAQPELLRVIGELAQRPLDPADELGPALVP